MHKVKNKILLMFLVCFSSMQAYELTEHQHNAFKNISFSSLALGAVGLGYYVAFNYKNQENFYVKNSHPYAQAWYDEMAVKYPEAKFDQRTFFSARRGFLTNQVSWESAFNNIYAPTGDLDFISKIYEKKQNNIDLSEQEKYGLFLCEFLLLHEAGHGVNQDSIGRYSFMIAHIIAIELAKLGYKQTNMYNPFIGRDMIFGDVYLDSVCGAILFYIGVFGYIRHTEARADKFAYDQAQSIEVLQAAQTFFENIDIIAQALKNPESEEDYELAQFITSHPLLHWTFDFLLDMQHPQPSLRAQNIANEIFARLQTVQVDC